MVLTRNLYRNYETTLVMESQVDVEQANQKIDDLSVSHSLPPIRLLHLLDGIGLAVKIVRFFPAQ